MIRALFLSLLWAACGAVPAMAQEIQGSSFPGPGDVVAVLLGIALTWFFAYQAFNRPPIALEDLPTPPRYMATRGQFLLGAASFVALSLMLFGIIVAFYRELVPFAGIINAEWAKFLNEQIEKRLINNFVVVAFAVIIFFSAVNIEWRWNPLSLVRTAIHSWVSIPHLTSELMTHARSSIDVPADAIAQVLGNPEAPNVAEVDFAKSRRTIDRIWAECCYMVFWLARYAGLAAHATFFHEPTFNWALVKDDYRAAALALIPLKRESPTDPDYSAMVYDLTDRLHKKLCRLVACFLVYKNDSDSQIFAEARAFGIKVEPVRRVNPLPYCTIYLVGFAFAIFIGVTLSSIAYDVIVTRADLLSAVANQAPELMYRWMLYTSATYGAPIILILTARYLGWRVDPTHSASYISSYCLTIILSFPISVLTLAVMVKLIGTSQIAQMPFFDLVSSLLKWGIGASIITFYVVRGIDQEISTPVEHANLTGSLLLSKIAKSAAFGVILTIFVFPSAMTAVSHNATWTDEKLRAMILGTTFMTGLVVGLIRHFLPFWHAKAGHKD